MADGVDSPIWQQDAKQTGLTLTGDFKAKNITATGTLSGVNSSVRSATVAASAAINTTDTVITAPIVLAAGTTLKVGSRIVATIYGTCTASVANASTFTIRAGILGTTGDASVATAAVTSAATGTAIPFRISLDLVVQTLGASGTAFGSMTVHNTGVTGIAAVTNTVVPFTSATFATTTATAFEVSYVSAAVTTTTTFQNVTVDVTP